MNATEGATVAEKKAVAKDKGKADIAAAAVENMAAGGMVFAGVEGRCGSLEPAICVT
jgi:hypothetical protein